MLESKKLQTTPDDLPESRAHRDPRVWALIHDARLAHEMLAVIKQLVDALNNTRPDNARQSREAIDAAAPFLDQED